ncbi:hypothetical protein T02_14089, partial [Trichinella nativa]
MYYRVLGRGLRVAGEDDPTAMETIFGWILCGPKTRSSAGKQETTMVSTVTDSSSAGATEELNLLLRRFWEIDSIGVVQEAETNPDEDVKRKFRESVTFDGTRYVVGLLWRAGAVHLPDNHEVAMRRLRALRRQLNRDPEKDQEYSGVNRDYLDRGWIEKVDGTSGPPGRTWYLPHHAVYQHNQGKTKCRVVLDGSAEWSRTFLNNCLDPGPKLQPDLVAVLLRFRRSRIALQADIEKMYLQVRLRPENRDVCRFLWQGRDCGVPVKRCGKIDALTDRVLSDMYVDDLATSCDGVDEARHLVQRLTEVMKTGGFVLKKWASNDPDALMDLPPEDVSSADEDRLWKTLGLHWNRHSDHLTFMPMPFYSMSMFKAKKLFQSLWLKGLHWDDQLPLDINSVWCQWKRELETLDSVRVPRVRVRVLTDPSQWPRLTIALSLEETRLASAERERVVTLCASLQEPSLLAIIDPGGVSSFEDRLGAHPCASWGPPCCFASIRGHGRPFANGRKTVKDEDNTALVPPSSLLPLNGLKAYICLLTCMVTRAVHLEVVLDMTTISFLAALRRFIARRGRPSVIYTDNFRTFKQADSFISMKNALRKVLGKALLRSWELHTVLCELEARINDQPLTLLSEDPHDCAPLTPAHFLIGRELASLPIPAASASAPTNASSLRKRWRHQQLLMKHLWNRWLEKYLMTLTSRGKWTKIGPQPEKGDLVFLVEEGVPRNRWKLDVIIEPLTGSDGVTSIGLVMNYGTPVENSLRLSLKIPICYRNRCCCGECERERKNVNQY